jgi:hypothetical protein
MKRDELKNRLLEEEQNRFPPKDLEEKVNKKISDFSLLHELFKHFTSIPLYLIDTKLIEGEDDE